MSLIRRWHRVALMPMLLASMACAQLTVSASAAAPIVSVATADPALTEIEATEQRVIQLINARRDKRGLRALRLDPRVAVVARARSQDMIDRHYFSHQDPDGKVARQHLEHAHITFSRVSEIIAWDRSSDLVAAAATIVHMWMSDSIHRHEVMSTTHNYLGAGVATDGQTVMWTVISITGRDRTDPSAHITSAVLNGGQATVRWTGHDPRLVVGTAGIRDYDLSRRDPGGAWQTVLDNTSRTSTTSAAQDGTEFRVRARDQAGNTGPWSASVTVTAATS